jgi:hypothetical protein
MKKRLYLYGFASLIICSGLRLSAQVGINTDGSIPDGSAMLDVKSSGKGLLPPRMTTAQRDNIGSPVPGLQVYNIDCNDMQFFNGTLWIPMGNTGFLETPGSITGSTTPCQNSTGVLYSIDTVENATWYQWTVPPGASIISGQGTIEITVNYGSTGGMICVAACNTCLRSTPSCLHIALAVNQPVSVSITAVPHPVCNNPTYYFLANPVNGGCSPLYQWNLNGENVSGATNANFVTEITGWIGCQLTSNASCIAGSPTASTFLKADVCESLDYGQPIVLDCQFEAGCYNEGTSFNWTNSSGSWQSSLPNPMILAGAVGYATDAFYLSITFSPPPGGSAQEVFFREVSSQQFCGYPITIHFMEGTLAPVEKTATYNTVANIPGETSKCWITGNLGSDQQAGAVDDGSELSAGWYWQFNRKQGYKHDGITRTPNTQWLTSISENSDWLAANDPCALEIGSGWRIPTSTEWFNVDAIGNWTNWNDPWNSGLSLHAAGYLSNPDGNLFSRGSSGFYWSSMKYNTSNGWSLGFTITTSGMNFSNKAYAYPVRCLREE